MRDMHQFFIFKSPLLGTASVAKMPARVNAPSSEFFTSVEPPLDGRDRLSHISIP
jgi:hypothetical protein